MSFFDEDDEPTQRTATRSPRRPSSPRAARPAGAGGGANADAQTLMIRRAVAVGVGVLVLVLLFVALRGCVASRKENALKDYNSEIASIIRESDRQVGRPFFELLSAGGSESPTDLQTAISGYRVTAEQQLDQAEGLDVPDEMAAAHESVLVALEFRRDALDGIAQRIGPALGDQGEPADEAIAGIAGQMQQFLASDVTWQARVVPLIRQALDEEEIGGQSIPQTDGFLPELEWLSEDTIRDRLGSGGGGGDDAQQDEEPAPGLHGTGLESVAVGETTLQPDAANRIPASADAILVRFANQGENDEMDVRVRVTISGAGEPIRVEETVDQVAQGQTAEASIPLERKPPAGRAVTIAVQVLPVPGEEKTDNNEQEYQALFVE